VLQWQLFEEHFHADLKDCVHHGKQPHQEQIGIRLQPVGEQFARTGAG
jgi:hypothetical protein